LKLKALIVLTLLLSLTAGVFAADTYNNTVAMRETKTDVTYTILWAAMDTASTDDHYSQAMYIGDCNTLNAFVAAWTSNVGSDDINLDIQYSFDRTTWKAANVASGVVFDDLNGGTVQADTLNVVAGVDDGLYHTAVWCRLVYKGQSGNPPTVTLFTALHFTKSPSDFGKIGKNRIRNKI